jgi:hypothetical protein
MFNPNLSKHIRLEAQERAAAPPETLIDLICDLDRYVTVEPRLTSARWLETPGPRAGAKLVLETEIPFTIPVIRRLFRRTETVVTITDWVPPSHGRVELEGIGYAGHLAIDLLPVQHGSQVSITGLLRPTTRRASIAFRVISPLIESLASAAIKRGIQRADAALDEPSEPRIRPPAEPGQSHR